MATGKDGGSSTSFWGKSAAPPPVPPIRLGRSQNTVEKGATDTGFHPLRDLQVGVNAVLHGTESPAQSKKDAAFRAVHPLNAGTAYTPVSFGLDQIIHAPSLLKSAHETAVKIAHPSAANPPSLSQNIHGLLGGALGFPQMGLRFDGEPHPRAVPKIQKGPQPTVKTLGESVTQGLQGARGLRAQQQALRSEEVAKRAQNYAKALQADPTMAGHQAAKAALAGELPKVSFAGFETFSPEAKDAMVKVVADHPTLQRLEKTRTIDAIGKITNGKLPTKSEEKLLRVVFGPDTTNQMMRSVSRFRRLKALGYDIGNIPRSVMASYDASGIMRQGLLVGTGHPVIFARNIPGYLKAIKSEDFYNAGMEGLHSRPNAVNGVYEKMGLDLTELTPRGSAAAREESFRSPLAEKIPGVRASGRGFTLYLDAARADLADYMYTRAQKLGRDLNDPHLLQSIGDVVNSASGRGDLGTGAIGRSQEGLNLLLFSPRLIKSRVDFINPLWYAKLDPLARHQAYRAMGGLVVLVAAALGISRAAGAQVNLDPRSSDFAKIRLGNTRLDLAGGFQQYIRLLSEIATQQTVNSSGVVKNLGPEAPGKSSDWDILFRFLRSKLAPISSAVVDASQQRNSVGQPLTWSNSVLSRFTPLSAQDAVSVGQDAAKKHGTAAGVAAGIGGGLLSAFGGGVQNYQPKQPKKGKSYWGGSSGGGSGSSYWAGSSGSGGSSGSSFWGK